MRNFLIQRTSLQAQLENLQASYDMTEQNFEIQKQTLSTQTENNKNMYDQDSADLQKIQHSIQNFKGQQENAIADALKKVRNQ